VRVVESGQHQTLFSVDGACSRSCQFLDFFRRTNGNDAISEDRDCFGSGSSGIHCVHDRVHDDRVGDKRLGVSTKWKIHQRQGQNKEQSE